MTTIHAVRAKLLMTRPYLASLAFALKPIERPGLGTVAVDKWGRLYFDPAALERWNVDQAAGALYHECLHILRGHFERLAHYSPQKANVGGDLEINDDIRGESVLLPDGALYPSSFGLPDNLLAEEYISRLPDAEYPRKSCGSCAHGHQEPWEEGPPSEGSPGLSEAEIDILRRRVAEDILRAPGNVPGHLRRWAEETLRPSVDWRTLLASEIRAAVARAKGMVDYTYQRPARRGHAYHPVILPSLVENRSNIAVIIDTSGSMSERDLSQIVAETMQIIRTAGVGNVTVMTADYDVHWVGKAARAKDIKLIGGGGTDMGRAIEAAERLRPRPEVIVVLTDGETPWPKCAPRARVIVGLTDREGSAPAWARKVYVDAGGGR